MAKLLTRWHLPSFHYNLSRAYPYKWFTWLTIVGGVLLVVLFSAINIAAVGYRLEVSMTSDPNTTLSQKSWTKSPPFSWFDKNVPTCEPQNLPIGLRFFTNQLGLQYTLESVWQTDAQDKVTNFPSLKYRNNTLEDCTAEDLVLDIDSFERSIGQFNAHRWGAEATTSITCTVNNDATPTYIRLSVSYDYISQRPEDEVLRDLNNQTKSSLWWGQSLVAWNYLALANALWRVDPVSTSQGNTRLPSRARYGMNTRVKSNITDMTSIRYFANETAGGEWWSVLCRDTTPEGATIESTDFCAGIDTRFTDEEIQQWWPCPLVWQEAHDYAITLYSVILADLGNKEVPNILTNATIIQYYSSKFKDITMFSDYIRQPATNRSYTELQDSTGPLGIHPSTIFAQYFCQIPKLRSSGSLFISVFTADLVFLSATWALLNWVVTMWTEHKDPDAMVCVGCQTLRRQFDDLRETEYGISPPESHSSSIPLATLVRTQSPATSISASAYWPKPWTSRKGYRHQSSDGQLPLISAYGAPSP